MAINLKNLKVNTPRVALEDYFWVIAGQAKAGKTSLFAKITEEYFGDVTKSLLLAFEKGYNALRVQAQDINDWDEFEEVVDQLVKDKDELGIKLIGIDTADIMAEMATASVIKDWNRSNPGLRTKDISGVGAKKAGASGFGVGYTFVKTKIRNAIDKLQKSGYSLMILTHSKDKKVEEKSGLEYDQLNLSLPATAREIFVNAADFICFVTVEKEKDENDNIVTKRYIYFRSDGFVEAGSRFKNVPERIEYDSTAFLDTFRHAVESEFANGTDLEQIKKEQAARREADSAKFIEEQKEAEKASELVAVIDTKIKALDKKQKLELVEKFKAIGVDGGNFKVVDDVDLLKKCLDIVEGMM